MTNRTISSLPSAGPLLGSEPVETVQGGASVKTTVRDIGNLGTTFLAVNLQTGTSYTLQLSDIQSYIDLNNASAITLTVPANSSVAFPIGTSIPFEQSGAGQVAIVASGGVTINSNGGKTHTNGQFAVASLVKKSTDIWTLFGNLQ